MEITNKTIHFPGLTQTEADRILKAEGFNELPSEKKQNWFFILFKVLSEPMLILLMVSGLIYLFIGELRDALMLFSFVLVVIGITFYQEIKTEKTLEALQDLSSPRALVIRDGEQIRIPGREVVRGDLVIIREGDRVPADATVLSGRNLSLDESLLTGESMPVRKAEWDGKMKNCRPGGDDLPFVYSGSMVTSGQGLARVNFVGVNTEIGKIGKSLEGIKENDTLLKKETAKIVRTVAIIGLCLCVLLVFAYVFIKGDLVEGFLAGLTLSMAMLPEEFPIVLLIFLTLGAWRISKNKVLTRRSAAIETLGAATVLCTDKTGTLTMNEMKLISLYAQNSFFKLPDYKSDDLSEKFIELLKYGVLASQKDPFDPIEKELNKMGEVYLKEALKNNLILIKEYPLSKELLALSHVWQSDDNIELLIASKGAPEAILNLCHADDKQEKEVMEKVKKMSDEGLRVLGVAKALSKNNKLSDNNHDFDFEFIGLLGFADPIRKTVPEAVKEAYGAGLRVIMITGDYPGTAQFVAAKIGIKNSKKYLTGEDLKKLSHQELREKIKTVNIFARVFPEQKMLIVDALKANNEIVVMTGDGVNDAPALKSAHIGIAMGKRGTDVAREASSLVLLNDDFSSIVVAVRLGRRIYYNLKRAMGYILSVHVPIAGMSLLPLFFNLPVMLFPAHIAFLELIIDPACSTVFEAEKEDKDIMKKPPRNLKQPLFDLRTVLISLAQGLGVLIATFVLFIFAIKSGRSESEARSFVFVSLVLANLMLIVVNLSWRKNIRKIILSPSRILLTVIIGAISCLLIVLYVPFFAGIFRLAPLGIKDFLLIIAAIFVSLSWFELLKLIKNKNGQY